MAIGECGLDFNRNFSPPEVQIEVFEKQVILIRGSDYHGIREMLLIRMMIINDDHKSG